MHYDPDVVQRILVGLTIFFFSLAIVSGIGELLGWWNDAGEIGMAVGTFGGLAAGLTTLLAGATRSQVHGVAGGVGAANTKLDSMDLKLNKLDKLDSMDAKLDKLDDLDKLDVITAELNDQTGVLDEQLEVLRAIRDGP